MTLDAELRVLERDALARPDDGRAQVSLARALDRLGRGGPAFEAYLRAAAADPSDAEVGRALDRVPWWEGPRGGPGARRWLPVSGVGPSARVAWVRPLGTAGLGLALDRGRIHARVLDPAGRPRLETLALHDGRSLYGADDAPREAAAPPLATRGLVHDAVLGQDERGVVLRTRARDGATGRVKWELEQVLTSARPGAALDVVALAAGRIVLAVVPQGKLTFDPLVRVIDAATGASLDAFEVRGLSDLAVDERHITFAATHDRVDRRIEARRLSDGARAWAAVRGARVARVVATERYVVAALEDGLVVLDPTGEERRRLPFRLLGNEALVATPRVLVGSWSRRQGVTAIDPLTGNVFWRDEPSPRVLAGAEGVIYGLHGDASSLHGLDLSTGEHVLNLDLAEVRRASTGSAGTGASRIAVAPGRVVGLTKDGVAFAVADA